MKTPCAMLVVLACCPLALAQIDILEPVVGMHEYVGRGNNGDRALVYFRFLGGLPADGVPRTTGVRVTIANAAGTPVGAQPIVTGSSLQQAPGPAAGDGDFQMENGEIWIVGLSLVLGPSTPVGAALVGLEVVGFPAVATAASVDGTNLGGADIVDERLQIIGASATPVAAYFDGSGAASRMIVIYNTPIVGWAPPYTAHIPFFGDQTVGGIAAPSLNSAQVGGGFAPDFEFTDGNDFNSNSGNAGTTDIIPGSFVMPPGTADTLQWSFNDSGSKLKLGKAFRVTPALFSTVRDSAGNLTKVEPLIAQQLPPLSIVSADWVREIPAGFGTAPDALRITFSRPINPAELGSIAFYANAGGLGESIRRGAPTGAFSITGLDASGVAYEYGNPTQVFLDIDQPANPADAIGSDGLTAGSLGDPAVGRCYISLDAAVGTPAHGSYGVPPHFQSAQNTTVPIGTIINPAAVLEPIRCAGDFNADGVTNVSDFAVFARNFGATLDATRSQGDLSSDGVVDVSDFILFASHFGCEAK